MNIDIEQLKELEEGKTYYMRFSEGTSVEELKNVGKTINDLNLKCMIVVGIGEYDIVDIPKGL